MSAVQPRRPCERRLPSRRGFTLLEVLIATVITLILTGLVVQMFAVFSDGIFNSRANIELSDMLRNARHRLIQDLRGVTAPTVPPLDPSMELGYFEYVEGGNVATFNGGDFGVGSVSGVGITTSDTISGDRDDILMFTTCSFDDPFVGRTERFNTMRSRFAEVAWFVRPVSGQPFCTLHRRVFLINPQANVTSTLNDEYADMDISAHQIHGFYERLAYYDTKVTTPAVDASGLGELTMREYRSLHQPNVWPHEILYVNGSTVIGTTLTFVKNSTVISGASGNWSAASAPPLLGMPSLIESTRKSNTNNRLSNLFPTPMLTETTYNNSLYHSMNFSITNPKPSTAFLKPPLSTGNTWRESEDVILTDVVAFDVKAWDPGAPVFRADSAPVSATQSGNTGVVGLIVPGDPGYGGGGTAFGGTTPKGALQNFIENASNASRTINQPVAFGAFVDLNYMWLFNKDGNTNVRSASSRMNRYLTALRQFELSSNVVRKDGYVRLPRPSFAFASPGNILSGYPGDNLAGVQFPSVYDTWSRHYEYDGIDNDGDGWIDEGADGIDNNGNGYVDEFPVGVDLSSPPDGFVDGNEMFLAELKAERDAPPPWDAPLRGIKVTIRVMEQDSRQVREVSTVHEFIPF